MKNTTIIIALMFLFSVSHAYAQEVGYRELLNLNSANIAKVSIGMSE